MAASQNVRLPLPGSAAGQLVLAGGGFMPARLLLVPVGTRLPPGVHAVAAVPATAVVAPVRSGSRAVHMLPLAAVPAPGPGEPAADDWEWEWEGAFAFHDFVDAQALDAIRVLGETLLPAAKADAQLATNFKAVHIVLNKAIVLAAQGHSDDKMGLALLVIRGSYGMVKLAHAAYPSDGLARLPGEQAFIGMCLSLADEDHSPPVILGQAVAPLLAPLLGSKLLGSEMPDGDADLVKSVFVAVAVSQAAARTARASYVSSDPADN